MIIIIIIIIKIIKIIRLTIINDNDDKWKTEILEFG